MWWGWGRCSPWWWPWVPHTYRETLNTAARGSALPVVRLAVVPPAEGVVRGGLQLLPGPSGPGAVGLPDDLGAGSGWGLCPAELNTELAVSLPHLPTGQAQDLMQQWASPHHPHFCDLMARAVSMGCHPWRSQQLDYMDTAVNSFKQRQSLCSSFKNWSSLGQQATPRRWPEVRVKLQGHCTPFLQVPLCSWGHSPKRATVVS